MSPRACVMAMLALCWASWVRAETVTWEAFVLAAPGRAVLGHGSRQYEPEKDVIVRERSPIGGRQRSAKCLRLDDAFMLCADVVREPSLDGFGLVVVRRGDEAGFSWEWFTRETDSAFVKLQGTGRLRVDTKKAADYEELEALEFQEDVLLRYLDDMSKPPGTHTHEILIRKGSVLRLAP
jgi:hypothetical protein